MGPARSSDPGLLDAAGTALLVDLYELTMSASYLARGLNHEAVFELFARRLPPERDWLLAAGLGPTLELVRELRYRERELAYLRSLGLFEEELDMASSSTKDAKSRLQEKVQKRSREVPVYEIVDVSGSDHNKVFSATVTISGIVFGPCEGKTKKKAEQSAALLALKAFVD